MRSLIAVICALFLITSFVTASLELQGEMTQGSLIRGKLPANSKLWLNNLPVELTSKGNFAFGFGRDAQLEHRIAWQVGDSEVESKLLLLTAREYQEQRIEGIPQKYVSPPKETLERIRSDNQKVAAARKHMDDRDDFTVDFIWPAEGPISGVFGSRRVFNGEPRRPHFGVDVAGPTGTPVVSPAKGIIRLWEPDLYYSGGTMIIDHGMGVTSTFLHLSAGHVKVGDSVEQGQLVAEIGATGRVTGAHLDWRINWLKERLDPALLVPPR